MPINESDLRPGDVIFFINNYKDLPSNDASEEEAEPQAYVDHVGMFVGFDAAGNPRIVHSITGSKGHYYPEKVSGLCITTLRTLRNQVQDDDGRVYDVQYRVFRGAFPEITAKALEVLKQQAKNRIPYDEQRLAKKLELEESLDGEDFKKMGMREYPKAGVFRSIKYAARYPFLLTRTRGDGVGRGLTCSMSVILAYQIAELLMDDKVTTINPALNEWPSDKYAPVGPADASLPLVYRNYLDGLKTPETQPRQEDGLKLSIRFWKGNTKPEDYRHKTFAIDAKCTGAEGMYLYMQECNDAWEKLGELHVAERQFSPSDKALHRNKLVDAYRNFLSQVNGMVKTLPVMCSPAKSPSPVPQGKAHLWWSTEDISTRMFSGPNKPDINQEEFLTLVSTDIGDSLSKIAQQLLKNFDLIDASSIVGLLLNTQSIRSVFYARCATSQLPAFYSNREICYQEFFKASATNAVRVDGKLKARPCLMFYPNDATLLDNLYGVFTKILFEQFIVILNTESDEHKASILTSLLEKGKKLFEQNKFYDAVSIYLAAQLVYCTLNNPTTYMHLQCLQLFLHKIRAFYHIEKTTLLLQQNISDLMIGEKQKAIDTLLVLQDTMPPEDYAALEKHPIAQRVKSYRTDLRLRDFSASSTQAATSEGPKL